jgi:hypothetical protein
MYVCMYVCMYVGRQVSWLVGSYINSLHHIYYLQTTPCIQRQNILYSEVCRLLGNKNPGRTSQKRR